MQTRIEYSLEIDNYGLSVLGLKKVGLRLERSEYQTVGISEVRASMIQILLYFTLTDRFQMLRKANTTCPCGTLKSTIIT